MVSKKGRAASAEPGAQIRRASVPHLLSDRVSEYKAGSLRGRPRDLKQWSRANYVDAVLSSQ